MEPRTDTYRYFVDTHNSDLTPMASVEAFLGALKLRILNISMGGMAFLMEQEPEFLVGDEMPLSISIRERAFPLQVEIKAIRGLRVSCSFIQTPPAFQPALREFMAPKFLGDSLSLNKTLLDLPAALSLVPTAQNYEPYVGQNQTGVFVWLGEGRSLKQMIAVSRDLVLGWDQQAGLRTGKIQPEAQGSPAGSPHLEVLWDRVQDVTVLNYLVDVLLAWLKDYRGRDFVDKLLSSDLGAQDESTLKFPIVS